jgi:hypothetical protein
MDGLACPCDLGDGYESCCGRLHAGAPTPTAESLMRSRYGERYPGLELAADQAGGERKMKDHAGHVALHPGG